MINDTKNNSGQSSEESQSDDKQASNSQRPTITTPKGGGAVRGIDEKFQVNPATGTGGQSIGLPISPGRGGFQPGLGLSYDSGSGNGPFGLGWNIGVPTISRKTDKGIPRYFDDIHNSEGEDTFVIAGAEDLVPVLEKIDNKWVRPKLLERSENGIQYFVLRYRPRIEGAYTRIERWFNIDSKETHWRAIDGGNVTSIFGLSADARIANPNDLNQVYSWLLEQTFDDKGNILYYEYKSEDSIGVDRFASHQRNRHHGNDQYAQKYLKRVHYGNRLMRNKGNTQIHFANTPIPIEDWNFMFQLVLDYGEHDNNSPTPTDDANNDWGAIRDDAFSSYRSGFEIRTQRLCQRVLMFHHFEELGKAPCLVASTQFKYENSKSFTYLLSATQTGYKKLDIDDTEYLSRSLPPVQFEYVKANISPTIHSVPEGSLENLPAGMASQYQSYIDLNSEGLSGFLAEKQGAWYYKANLGGGNFAPAQVVARTPAVSQQSQSQLVDLGGNGRLDLVSWNQSSPGYYERSFDLNDAFEFEESFKNFETFKSIPNVNWSDPNLRLIDLSGDGHADILITEHQAFTWYPSIAKQGYAQSEKVKQPFDEEQGPALIFADQDQSIYLADMSGDGLVDLVRIRNGEVCYWPNSGYGKFGAKITFDNSPTFDRQEQFNQSRLRLTDIDGSGRSDIIYLHADEIKIYFNESGNRLSDPHSITQFPAIDNLSQVTTVDLLGDGTSCLVWSSPLHKDQQRPMQYIRLMADGKPHLLSHVKNNMGSETKIQYTASTKFYLEDKVKGQPWVTKLHFPVHVVEKTESFDFISNTKFVSSYSYHHGYYDGEEREFRGFARVEQLDTETFEAFSGKGLFTETPNIVDEEFHLPPVRSVSWFHTGAYLEGTSLEKYFKIEEYYQDPKANFLDDTILPSGLSASETREAARALKGAALRQEVYAVDGTPLAKDPYSVSETSYELTVLQPRGKNKYAVFVPYQCEALSFHYERNNEDPRINHAITLEVDAYGTVIKSAAIAYPRREQLVGVDVFDEQKVAYGTYSEVDVVYLDSSDLFYRLAVPIESRTYELTQLNNRLDALSVIVEEGIEKDKKFSKDILKKILGIGGEQDATLQSIKIAYDIDPKTLIPIEQSRLRLVEHSKQSYLKDDLSACLPIGQVESLVLPCQSYTLAFTKNQVDSTYPL